MMRGKNRYIPWAATSEAQKRVATALNLILLTVSLAYPMNKGLSCLKIEVRRFEGIIYYIFILEGGSRRLTLRLQLAFLAASILESGSSENNRLRIRLSDGIGTGSDKGGKYDGP